MRHVQRCPSEDSRKDADAAPKLQAYSALKNPCKRSKKFKNSAPSIKNEKEK
jgi:hypothetical protein